MAKLQRKVNHALNESRILILGAEVLLGIQLHASLQPGFDTLPASLQLVMTVALGLMVLAIGLLIAPATFHHIVEDGRATRRMLAFTTFLAAVALLPLALALALDFAVAGQQALGPRAVVPCAVVAGVVALAAWYGLEWSVRQHDWQTRRAEMEQRRKHAEEQAVADEREQGTSLETKISQSLVEVRTVLPGAQALLGFQFIAYLATAFDKLPILSKEIHLASTGLVALSVICLMAPSAFHRIVEAGEDTNRVEMFISRAMLLASAFLALGIAGDFYVVLQKVLKADAPAALIAGLTVAFCYGLWFGLTGVIRLGQSEPRVASEMHPARPGA